MRKLLLILFTSILLFSCEDEEENDSGKNYISKILIDVELDGELSKFQGGFDDFENNNARIDGEVLKLNSGNTEFRLNIYEFNSSDNLSNIDPNLDYPSINFTLPAGKPQLGTDYPIRLSSNFRLDKFQIETKETRYTPIPESEPLFFDKEEDTHIIITDARINFNKIEEKGDGEGSDHLAGKYQIAFNTPDGKGHDLSVNFDIQNTNMISREKSDRPDTNGSTDDDVTGGGNEENCSNWIVVQNACAAVNGRGVHYKLCNSNLGNGQYKYTLNVEPINGGIDTRLYQTIIIETTKESWNTSNRIKTSNFNSNGFTISKTVNDENLSVSVRIDCGL